MSLVVPVPIIAERTRDLISPISDYSLYLCHDGAGTTLTDSAPADQQLFGDLTINGTTAGIWATEGNFTPAGDHTIQKNSAAQQAAGILTTANQLIFAVDLYAEAAPAAINMLCMYGRTGGGGRHGIRISIETTGRFQVQHVSTTGTITSSNSGVYGSVCDSTKHCLVAVLDAVNGTIATYVDGTVQGSNSIANLGDTADSRGWGILANITSDAPAFNSHFGVGLTNARINRFLAMRTTSDQSENIGSIVTGLAEIAHELPWALDGI